MPCERAQDILFTDEMLLRRIAKARFVTTFNVPEVIGMLARLGDLDAERTRRLVADLHRSGVRTFGANELAALGFDDFV